MGMMYLLKADKEDILEQGFIDILKKLVKEQGKAALTDTNKCKAFLADYTGSEYKKESRWLEEAVKAGVAKAIDGADDLAACKKAQIKEVEEELGRSSTIAADIVNTLALVLRGDTTVTASASVEKDEDDEWEDEDEDEDDDEMNFSFQRDNAEEAQAALKRARNYMQKGQLDYAINDLNMAISLNPNFAEAYAHRGDVYIRKNQIDNAIRDCTEAIRLDPYSALGYKNRGTANIKGNFNQAMSDFNEAIRLDPKDASAYKGRGIALMEKNPEYAISDFNEAIRLNPNYDDAYVARGVAYANLQNFQQAISDFKRALSINPYNNSAKGLLQNFGVY